MSNTLILDHRAPSPKQVAKFIEKCPAHLSLVQWFATHNLDEHTRRNWTMSYMHGVLQNVIYNTNKVPSNYRKVRQEINSAPVTPAANLQSNEVPAASTAPQSDTETTILSIVKLYKEGKLSKSVLMTMIDAL